MHKNPRPIGTLFLVDYFDLKMPELYFQCYAHDGTKQTERDPQRERVFYPAVMEPSNLEGHLTFALKHEPMNFLFWHQLGQKLDPQIIRDWIKSSPTSAYAKRAWFLLEECAGRDYQIVLPRSSPYVDLLNEDNYITTGHFVERKHLLFDNRLGMKILSPIVRKTSSITSERSQKLKQKIEEVWSQWDASAIERAANYLYLKETKSSYAIEKESVPKEKNERFIELLRRADSFKIESKKDLVELQNLIVDPRYAEPDFRKSQVYVGESIRGTQRIHYICPKAENVDALMDGWFLLARDLELADPVVAAAVLSFMFVYIHPFEDGNGRIHRFILHYWLAKKTFVPKGTLVPISAAILRNQSGYDAALEDFSKQIAQLVEYDLDHNGEMTVKTDSFHFYRFIDFTKQVEFIYDCIEDSVQNDFIPELEFLTRFDKAMKSIERIIDMPNKRASLLLQLVLQNSGKLAKGKRDHFAEVTDLEIQKIEDAVAEVWGDAQIMLPE